MCDTTCCSVYMTLAPTVLNFTYCNSFTSEVDIIFNVYKGSASTGNLMHLARTLPRLFPFLLHSSIHRMGSNDKSGSFSRPAPTSHAAIDECIPAAISFIAANGQDDDDLLHPKPRKSVYSKKDLTAQKHLKRTGVPVWESGTLIRLLPDAVHMNTDSIEDVDSFTAPPPVVPQRLSLPLTSQVKLVGLMCDEGLDRFWYEGTTSRGWREGIPIFMRILPMDPTRFTIMHANGDEVKDHAYVEWSTGFQVPELRDKAAERQRTKLLREIKLMDRFFKDAAKRYRIARRLWEIEVVRHQFFVKQNYAVFRPGTTKRVVWRAIRMGKADIASED
jgi:hypothetical protein